MLETLHQENFEKNLNTTFTIQVDDQTSHELELIEVSALTGSDSSNEARQPFSLLFRGGPELFLEQQIHELQHPDMGTLSLFIVPLAPNEEGTIFECVFN